MKKAGDDSWLHHVATFLINTRYAIITLFVLITVAMGFSMMQLRIETGFKKQLPLKHEYMQTFLQYEQEFGGRKPNSRRARRPRRKHVHAGVFPGV